MIDPLVITSLNYNTAKFEVSASQLNECPSDIGREIAFSGRSNAGKSSVLNRVTGLKKLAKTSKTPGRTRLLNFFTITSNCRLVDLPGYGYAKVPIVMKEKWLKELNCYLERRKSLSGIVILMDIRHPLKDTDKDMLYWAIQSNLPAHVLLTKADKLRPSFAKKTLQNIKCELSLLHGETSVQLFSCLKNIGVEELQSKLDFWLTSTSI